MKEFSANTKEKEQMPRTENPAQLADPMYCYADLREGGIDSQKAPRANTKVRKHFTS